MTVQVRLGRSQAVALVDDGDAALVAAYNWYRHENGHGGVYARGYRRGERPVRYVYMHALIAGYPRPDHQDRDGLNNRRSNLRPATDSQNHANMGPWPGCQYKGVTRTRSAWLARITVNRKSRHLGSFRTPEDAARAYDVAALAAWGQYARVNFPG
jgi:hypothetical protein